MSKCQNCGATILTTGCLCSPLGPQEYADGAVPSLESTLATVTADRDRLAGEVERLTAARDAALARVQEVERERDEAQDHRVTDCEKLIAHDREVATLRARLDAMDSFSGVMVLLRSILDDRYPPDVFPGTGVDPAKCANPGAAIVAVAREVAAHLAGLRERLDAVAPLVKAAREYRDSLVEYYATKGFAPKQVQVTERFQSARDGLVVAARALGDAGEGEKV